ncbi:hypothetical protein P3S67_003991 [Capsicum chacoense]
MTMAVVDSIVFLVAVALLFNATASQSIGYTNRTVGGLAGWFFDINTQKPSADYSTWAAKQTFNLSDYLSGNIEFGQAMAIAVALTIEGGQYNFSDADDGN